MYITNVKSYLIAVLMGILWVANLFNSTGLDSIYHVIDRITLLLFVLTFIFQFNNFSFRKNATISNGSFFTYLGLLVAYIVWPYFNNSQFIGTNLIGVYCLVYLLSLIDFDEIMFRWTGIFYAICGTAVLYIYNFGSTFSGWNSNGIAMIGLFSYLFLIIAFFEKDLYKYKWYLLCSYVIIAYLLQATNSRAGILFTFIAVVMALNIVSREWFVKDEKRILFVLNIPLLLAIFIALFSLSADMDALDAWSYTMFNKPIFNGRDILWQDGFKALMENPFLGSGLFTGNWHNCAVAALYTGGIIGYIAWIKSLNDVLIKGLSYVKDSFVCGCMVCFLIILLQQAVELGIFSYSPNWLPYIMLGMMLGRIRYINKIRTKDLDND